MAPPTAEEQQQAATSAFLAAMQHSHQQLQQQQQRQQQQQQQQLAGVAGGDGAMQQSQPQSQQQQQFHMPPSYTQQQQQPLPLKREQADDDGDDDDEEDDASPSGSGGQQTKAPPRKAQRRSSGSNTKASGSASATAGSHSAGDNPPGPPYVCPACKTTYSRLEYLRRHERRHQDIRPFVCECGKGFSRSDVLSRHKKQCHYHLTGEQPSAEAAEAASKKTRKPSSATNARSRKTSSSGGGAAAGGGPSGSQAGGSGDQSPQPGQPYPNSQSGDFVNNGQAGQAPPLLPQAGAPGGMGLPPPPPFYSQHPTNAAAAAAAAAAVAAGHGGPSNQAGTGTGVGGVGAGGGGPPQSSASQDGNTGNQANANTDYSRANGFMSAIHHALNTFGHHNSHSNYPPSPESNVSSRNSSPRLHYRDAIPYTHRSGSTGGGSRQSSLRKGTLDPYHAPVPWGAENQDGRSSPAPGSSTSRPGSLFGKDGGSANPTRSSSGAGASAGAAGAGVGSGVGLPGFSSSASSAGAPSFSYPANEFAAQSSASGGNSQSQTLAPAGTDGQNNASSGAQQGQQGQQPSSHPHSRADPPRFAVSTGPLSPFSGMGLASSMSPYLSAFSNARDTPLVASPGRGIAPGTPNSSLNTNVFDFTMRPPPKPASTASQGRNGSGSAPDNHNKGAGAQGVSSSSSTSAASKSRGGPIATTSPQGGHDPSTPSASVSAADGGSLPALADFIDDQQRSAANGLLTLLGGGGAETPSRFVRSDAGRPSGGASAQGGEGGADSSNTTAGAQSSSSSSSQTGGGQSRPDTKSNSAMDSNPGTNSADPSSNPFFEPAVTPGPEAFFLRLQGGEQDHRAGMSSSSASGANNVGGGGSNSIGGHYSHLPSSVVNGLLRDGIGQHHQQSDSAPSGGAGVDTPNYGMGSGGWGDFGLSNASAGNVGWLLSPSIQALISSFATGATPGIGGDASGGGYFALARNHGPSAMGATPSLKPILASSVDLDGGAAQAEGKPSAAINGVSSGSVNTKEGSGPEGEKVSFIDLGTLALEKAFDDIKNPFYLPRSMFKTCYSVPHWHLPSRARLSMLAMHSQQNLCKHVPILHEPTFRLDSTPGCLAFAVCMLGCHEVGRRWFGGLEVVPLEKAISTAEDKPSIEESKDGLARDEEDNQELVKPIVMTEKMDMLMRSFPSRCTHIKDKVSVVQALLLFQTSNFLSTDTTVRAIASISHSSVVGLARKAGFFDASAEHVAISIDYTPELALQRLLADNNELAFAFSFLPSYLPSCSDEEKVWRLWCEYEGRRRTAFLLFLMDTVASLDAGVPLVVKIEEVKHLPLPAPDFIWRASDAKSFRTALESYKAPILDDAMAELLKDEEGEGGGDGEDQKADKVAATTSQTTQTSSPTILTGQHGPFARLMAILPILRGIVHLLQDRTDKPSPLQSWLRQSHSAASGEEANGVKEEEGTEDEQIDAQVDLFKRALSRWREGWDQDPLCLQASSPVAQAKAEAARKAEELVSQSVGGAGGADSAVKAEAGEGPKTNGGTSESTKAGAGAAPSLAAIFTSKTASGATPLCEDALPFYWLSHVLLGHATSQQVSTSSPTNRQGGGEGTNGQRERGRQTSSAASSTGSGTGGGGSSASSPSEERKRKNSSANGGGGDASARSASSTGGAGGAQRRVPDFRNMLRFAKTFVKSGEGVNGTTSGGQLAFTPATAAATATAAASAAVMGKEESSVDSVLGGGEGGQGQMQANGGKKE